MNTQNQFGESNLNKRSIDGLRKNYLPFNNKFSKKLPKLGPKKFLSKRVYKTDQQYDQWEMVNQRCAML